MAEKSRSEIVIFEEQGKMYGEAGGITASLIRAALDKDFTWPDCWEDFDKIRRMNPEVTVVRSLYTSTARNVHLYFEPPEDPTPVDKEFTEFLNSALADVDLEKFKETLITQVPIMGWGFWEIVPGLREPGWVAPDGVEWESFDDDGLVGIRKLAWRDQSTLYDWQYDEAGKVIGMMQRLYGDNPIPLPLDKAVHLTFGDPNIPTGLSPLQAVSRLQRIKHALEVVQGMGFEHAAGYVSFKVKGKLDAEAKGYLKDAAKAIMTAKHGSYVTEIDDLFEAKLIDVTFQAASDILESIRYYGIMILQIFATHFIAVATTADTGSYSASQDHSRIFLTAFNSIMEGFASQAGRQIAKYLRRANGEKFRDISKYPTLKASKVQKVVELGELGDFLEAFARVLPMDEADARAIRERSEVLPATQPEASEDITKEQGGALGLSMEQRNLEVEPKGDPGVSNTNRNRQVEESEVQDAIDTFDAFCAEYFPEFVGLLEARVVEEEE